MVKLVQFFCAFANAFNCLEACVFLCIYVWCSSVTPSRWRARSLGGERGTPSHAVVTVRRRRARDEPPSEHAIRCGRSLSRNNVELKAPCPPVGQKLLEGDQCPSSGCSRRPRTTTGGGRGERLRVSWGGVRCLFAALRRQVSRSRAGRQGIWGRPRAV